MSAERKTCPRCRTALTAAKGPGLTLDVCRRCGGIHFDNGELANLANRRPDELDDVEELVEPAQHPSKQGRSRGLRCAECSSKMETYEYGYCSGVTLDRCARCFGIWVDDGELQAIQDHLEAVRAGIKPGRATMDAGDAAVAMAEMDAKLEQTQARARALRAFTGHLRMRRLFGLW